MKEKNSVLIQPKKLSTFIENHCIPYFANTICKSVNGNYSNGEYSHGNKGFFEYYIEIFNTEDIKVWNKIYSFLNAPKIKVKRNSLCPCGSHKKLKYCRLETINKLMIIGIETIESNFKKIGIL